MNANAIVKLGGRAICSKCNTELFVKDVFIEEDPIFSAPKDRQHVVCQIIDPCSKCLEILNKLRAANITINLEKEAVG